MEKQQQRQKPIVHEVQSVSISSDSTLKLIQIVLFTLGSFNWILLAFRVDLLCTYSSLIERNESNDSENCANHLTDHKLFVYTVLCCAVCCCYDTLDIFLRFGFCRNFVFYFLFDDFMHSCVLAYSFLFHVPNTLLFSFAASCWMCVVHANRQMCMDVQNTLLL